MKHFKINLLALALLLFAGTACEEGEGGGDVIVDAPANSDWHTDRGQTNHNSVDASTFPSSFAQQWSNGGGNAWQGSVTLGQGNLYIGDASGSLQSMDPSNGSGSWNTAMGGSVSMAATAYKFASEERVLATAANGRAAGIDPGNGNVLWSITTDPVWISAFNHDAEQAFYVHTINCDTITIIDFSLAKGGSTDPILEGLSNARLVSRVWKDFLLRYQDWIQVELKKAIRDMQPRGNLRLQMVATKDPRSQEVSLTLEQGKNVYTMQQNSTQDTITIIDMQAPSDTITIIDLCLESRQAGSCTRLRSVNPANGSINWNSSPLPITTATPLTTDEGVGLAMRSKTATYAMFNDASGEATWVYGDGTPSGGSVDSGLLDKDNGNTALIYINPRFGDAENSANVVALKASDGSLVWDQPLPNNGYVHGFARTGDKLIAAQNGHLYCLDLAGKGNLLWTYDFGSNYSDPCTYRGPQPVIWGDQVAMVTDQSVLTILELNTGAVSSSHNLDAQVRATPGINGTSLFVATAAGTVYAFGN